MTLPSFRLPRVTLASTFWILLAAVLSPSLRPAHAYLDPGTGSYVIQMSIGLLFGGIYSCKKFIGIAYQKMKARRNTRKEP